MPGGLDARAMLGGARSSPLQGRRRERWSSRLADRQVARRLANARNDRQSSRSLVDLIATLQELAAQKVGFVSLSEALDLTTPSGRAFAGILAVFSEFERDIRRDRVRAGIAQARKEGRPQRGPATTTGEIQEL